MRKKANFVSPSLELKVNLLKVNNINDVSGILSEIVTAESSMPNHIYALIPRRLSHEDVILILKQIEKKSNGHFRYILKRLPNSELDKYHVLIVHIDFMNYVIGKLDLTINSL